jgi:hypothetical protein
LSKRRHENGGEREKDYSPKDLQRVDGQIDERKRKDLKKSKFQNPNIK